MELHFASNIDTLSEVIKLDNCMGNGTTAIACMNTQRNFIGIEMEKGYYDIACKRIEDNKGETNESRNNR